MSTIHRILALSREFVGSEVRKAQLIIRITGRALKILNLDFTLNQLNKNFHG